MEIFCAARFQQSERGMFLTVVSALEPLAETQPLESEVNEFVSKATEILTSVSGISQEVIDSLRFRLAQLRRESIRQALKRLVRETLPENPDAPRIIDNAYALRSQIVHNGRPDDLDIDLEHEAVTIAALIRDIYAILLQRRSAG
jgi:hypothetical protein